MMEIFEVVMKLIGNVQPSGDHGADQLRLRNMKNLTALVDKLLFEINEATPSADMQAASMKAIGEHARTYLRDVHNS